MPFESRYIREFDIMVQVMRGAITLEELIAGKRAEMARGEHGPGTVWLTDARTMEADLSFIEGWAAHLRQEYPDLKSPGAALVDAPLATALASLGAKKIEGQRPGKVFSTLEAALSWLGRDPERCTAEALGIDP